MTAYVNIYQDLPDRVNRIWAHLKTQKFAKTSTQEDIHEVAPVDEDLSVTSMLMAAATGLAMPWESLKDVGSGNRDSWNAHPSFKNGDQDHYRSVLTRCDEFLAQKISESSCLKSISFRKCQELSEICEVAEYGAKGEKLEIDGCQVKCAVRVIRNALAHNNIVAFGSNLNQIDRLGFFSENRIYSGCTSSVDGYFVITIAKVDFQNFLNAWFLTLSPENKKLPKQ